MTDPAPVVDCANDVDCVINELITALREAFDPNSACPPLGGGTKHVRVFAGDAIPLSAWDAHRDGEGCDQPFVWVRLVRRYRTQQFPAPFVGPAPCGLPKAVAIEIGVGRCAVVDTEPAWEDYANEAEISIDDSWRIDLALCRAMGRIERKECGTATAIDAVVPYGPEGGVIAQIGTAYVQL
ncbi:hypothetical protein OED52_13640 [Rhodococcus sp. Z13]|uniref:Uncharacterized protein n=1 Tax=Rhodococcus sacchari TaxID=2962047 RepID=A0ACD4DCA0_9NOCA|nr:hypothetical protein [Rhodococcus sp. Z13]UYP17714.1 hypothetical protein OED52_13640 [Rhodococcus sp. Z13]